MLSALWVDGYLLSRPDMLWRPRPRPAGAASFHEKPNLVNAGLCAESVQGGGVATISHERETQTEEYWRDRFTTSQEDMEAIYELFLEKGVPLSLGVLAEHVMAKRCEREEAKLQEIAETKGEIYQPRNSYQIGQPLFFPALGDVSGTVVGVRAGENPDYGPFDVIQVEITGQRKLREFAASYLPPHVLNRDEGQVLSPQRLYRLYGDYVQFDLADKLRANPDFVVFGQKWFLEGLMVEVHLGHLNIAEAMIILADTALAASDLLKEIELPEGVHPAVKEFSLNYALSRDERFINIRPGGSPLWMLSYSEQDTGSE